MMHNERARAYCRKGLSVDYGGEVVVLAAEFAAVERETEARVVAALEVWLRRSAEGAKEHATFPVAAIAIESGEWRSAKQ